MPHIVSFRCGSKSLLCVRGRPPLCLKGMTVGHMRRDCRTDAGARRPVAVSSPPTMTEAGAWRETAVQDPPRAVEEPGQRERHRLLHLFRCFFLRFRRRCRELRPLLRVLCRQCRRTAARCQLMPRWPSRRYPSLLSVSTEGRSGRQTVRMR